jgi:hypothetical protein
MFGDSFADLVCPRSKPHCLLSGKATVHSGASFAHVLIGRRVAIRGRVIVLDPSKKTRAPAPYSDK